MHQQTVLSDDKLLEFFKLSDKSNFEKFYCHNEMNEFNLKIEVTYAAAENPTSFISIYDAKRCKKYASKKAPLALFYFKYLVLTQYF